MRLSDFSLFTFRNPTVKPSVAVASLDDKPSVAVGSLPAPATSPKATVTNRNLPKATDAEIELFKINWFLPTQSRWAYDNSPLKIWQKSRQVAEQAKQRFGYKVEP